MNSLSKTESHIPWTRGEVFTIGHEAIINRLKRQRKIEICRKSLYPIGLANLAVLANNSMFPNFKEEINVL